jgi:predicted AAA+ superfamily ATPase
VETISRQLKIPIQSTFFLFGPRQTGKSTLLDAVFTPDNCLTYNLLHNETYSRLAARPQLLRAEVESAVAGGGPLRVIIDEVQRVPALLDEVHALIEAHKRLQFAMCGSSARKLKRMHANMLGGRARTLRLFPFTSIELGGRFDLERVLRFGALPGIYFAEDDTARSELLRSYVETYLREEIEIEAQVRNLGAFLRFLPMAASENGAQVNVLNVARETSITKETARGYYQILEDTLVGFFLFPFAKSVRKKIARHPKFYFFDCGVVRGLTKKLSSPMVEESEEYGRAFEHFLICEILRLNDYERLDLDISFYRTESGTEVDCVLLHPDGTIWAIEIKSTRHPALSHCRGLRSFSESFPQAVCMLACRAPRPMRLSPFDALPWQEVVKRVAALAKSR